MGHQAVMAFKQLLGGINTIDPTISKECINNTPIQHGVRKWQNVYSIYDTPIQPLHYLLRGVQVATCLKQGHGHVTASEWTHYILPNGNYSYPIANQNLYFNIQRDHGKKFPWAMRLWIGRRRDPILGNISKFEWKTVSSSNGLISDASNPKGLGGQRTADH